MARFLVIDDDGDVGAVVQMILEIDGHEAGVATDAETAMQMQRARPFDVLITDIFMPDKDGFEVIRDFRREFPAVSIIAMSGGGEMLHSLRYLESARAVGAVHAIRKPFEKESLLAVVHEVLMARTAARPSDKR